MRLPRYLAAVTAAVPTTVAHACTVCDSANGHQLRAGLFNGHFLHTLGVVAAPVPVLLGAVLLLHRLLPGFPEPSTEHATAQTFSRDLVPAEAAQ